MASEFRHTVSGARVVTTGPTLATDLVKTVHLLRQNANLHRRQAQNAFAEMARLQALVKRKCMYCALAGFALGCLVAALVVQIWARAL